MTNTDRNRVRDRPQHHRSSLRIRIDPAALLRSWCRLGSLTLRGGPSTAIDRAAIAGTVLAPIHDASVACCRLECRPLFLAPASRVRVRRMVRARNFSAAGPEEAAGVDDRIEPRGRRRLRYATRALDRFQEVSIFERLMDNVLGTQDIPFGVPQWLDRHDDRRDAGKLWMPHLRRAKLPPIDVRHYQVQENGVETCGGDFLQCIQSVRCFRDFVPLLPKQGRHPLTCRVVVFDDQD